MAEAAVALRMAPSALLDCDDEVLEGVLELVERERTAALWALEVQALTAEMVHALWRLTVQVNSKKGARPPQPLHLPRPWRDQATAPPRGRQVSVLELIRMTGTEG
jgi:hypothetical protein